MRMVCFDDFFAPLVEARPFPKKILAKIPDLSSPQVGFLAVALLCWFFCSLNDLRLSYICAFRTQFE